MSNASIYAAGSRSSFTLTATVNGTNKDAVTWSSSNTGVAKVTNGVVQGTGAGNATITASFGGSKATCSVNVMRQTISMSGRKSDLCQRNRKQYTTDGNRQWNRWK